MKKCYIAPELELIRYSLREVLAGSPLEDGLTDDNIGGNGNGSDIDLDFGL